MRKLIKKIFKLTGFQVKRYPDYDLARRLAMLGHYNINVLLDIGANTGQYAQRMRELGYDQKIISFEPLSKAYSVLAKAASKDKNWQAHHHAIGSANSKSVINVAGNSYSSSILNMLPKHIDSAPESKYIGQEEIEIKTLDSIYQSLCSPSDRVMVKIDTQGYEKHVLDGASKSLEHIQIIQMEMSIVPLYENEMLYLDMIAYMREKGFSLFSMESGFWDTKTGQLLQLDGIFVRQALLPKSSS